LPTFSPANKIASFVDSSIIQFDANDSVTVFGVTGLPPGQSPAAKATSTQRHVRGSDGLLSGDWAICL